MAAQPRLGGLCDALAASPAVKCSGEAFSTGFPRHPGTFRVRPRGFQLDSLLHPVGAEFRGSARGILLNGPSSVRTSLSQNFSSANDGCNSYLGPPHFIETLKGSVSIL